jgi:putative DNA primase/helicase
MQAPQNDISSEMLSSTPEAVDAGMTDSEIFQHEKIGNELLEKSALVNADEVRRALAVLLEPNAVFEIRALGARLRGNKWKTGTVSGYFDSVEACIAQLPTIAKAAGIYVTLNPVDSSLIGRRANRLDYAEREATTGDQHILKRRWLLIDCDAKRPSGISASDAEKDGAREKAREVYHFLQKHGWAPPVASDSGNGFHLLYRVNLPTDDNKLIERLLVSLANRFDGDGVKIDRTMFNPARIVRLYGTRACKGDSVPERPHRVSSLCNTPDELRSITAEQLQVLIPKEEPRQHSSKGGGYDVEGFLKKHAIPFTKQSLNSDGVEYWRLEQCPFNSDHGARGEVVLMRLPSGAAAFKCQHESCKDNKWPAFKSHYEAAVAGATGRTTPDGCCANDSERAECFADSFSGVLRYVHLWGQWVVWDGIHWQIDVDGAVMRKAQEMPKAFVEQASTIDDPEKRKRAWSAALRTGNKKELSAMISLAESNPKIAASPTDFDADPLLVGVKNGCIDLRTGEFRQSQRDDFVSKQLGTAFDTSAVCPLWERFIARVLNRDSEIISYVQRAVGYSLTGIVSEQCLFFLHGQGCNGKSTFIELLQALLGDYMLKSTPKLYTVDKHGREPETEIARVISRRLVTGAETEEGSRLAESRVKDLTGGDTLTGRFLYGRAFNFRPTHKLWIYGNHRPDIGSCDNGIWRRIKLIPFDVTIPPHEKDGGLPQKLTAELPGILNWAITGCLEWQKLGLAEPGKVAGATAAYREEEDELGEFIEDSCVRRGHVDRKSFYHAYELWASENGIRMPMKQRAFAKRMRSREGIAERESNGSRYWEGISLRSDAVRGNDGSTVVVSFRPAGFSNAGLPAAC